MYPVERVHKRQRDTRPNKNGQRLPSETELKAFDETVSMEIPQDVKQEKQHIYDTRNRKWNEINQNINVFNMRKIMNKQIQM